MDKKELTFKEIWDTLYEIDVSKHTEKKMNLTYLSWSRAWTLLMKEYPQATYTFVDFEGVPYRALPDGTTEVATQIKIEDHVRSMLLPIMDHKNNAVENPNARQVNDNRMRCLVKNLAMFGLGMKVFTQFEDHLPDPEKDKKPVAKKKTKKEEGFDANGSPTKEEPKKEDDVSMNEAWAKTFIEGFEKMVVAFDKSEQVKDFYMSNEQDILAIKDIDKKYKKQIDDIVKKQIRLKEDNNG